MAILHLASSRFDQASVCEGASDSHIDEDPIAFSAFHAFYRGYEMTQAALSPLRAGENAIPECSDPSLPAMIALDA